MLKLILTKFCLWAAIPCLLGFPVAVAAYRWQWWSLDQSFTLIIVTFAADLVLLVLTLFLFLVAWRRKDMLTLKTSGAALVLLAIPAIGLSMQLVKGQSLPPIHDITTNTIEPPQFVDIVPLRGAGSNPLIDPGEDLAQLLQQAYPNIQPLVIPINQENAFNKALTIVQQLGWELVAQDQAEGRIEAVDTTLLWGFKDDVVIRIRSTETGSQLDLRSVSRVGKSDLGANAARIERFVNAFTANN